MPLITVFTPTYNRAYILPMLYNSLLNQESNNFEWLIIDDGSTDNTKALIDKWLLEQRISIRYLYQENKGKSLAINSGVENALGELFFIVDSDDQLTNDAVLQIECYWSKLLYNGLAGLCFRRINLKDKQLIGSRLKFDINETVSNHVELDLPFDKAEVFVTSKLREFKFPRFNNEKFVPESLVWCQITEKYGMYYVLDKGIYLCEYLPDGYTVNFNRNLKRNPKGFMAYYKYVFLNDDFGYLKRLKAFIRYLQIQCFRFIK